MNERLSQRDDPLRERPPAPLGLRLRLWLASIAGGVVAGLGSLWVLGTKLQPGATDPGALLAWLAGVAGLAVLTGAAAALWLDHHLVGHLRGLLRGLGTGRVSELRGLPAATGWGEVSDLTDALQSALTKLRQSGKASQELEQVNAQLESLRSALDGWVRSERWESPATARGPVAGIAETFGRGLSRRSVIDEQNREAAKQVAHELSASLEDSQSAAEQAERGFVEATALLTTVRELQRLSLELQNALAGPAAAPEAAGDDEEFRKGAREALEELVTASNDSVQGISRGLMRVQDISEQVQRLGNRATLIAIHAVMSGSRDAAAGPAGDDLTGELKQLAHDVRDATERTSQFALEIENEVTTASERMRDVRERTLAALERLPESVARAQEPRGGEDARRLLERVREMVQDAARKGERLSAAGERASRAAERLARRLEDEAQEAEALVVRLAPVGEAPLVTEPTAPPPRSDAPGPDLRVVEPPSEADESEPIRGAGEERP